MLGWIANIFIVIGLWKIGNKERRAFVYTVIGEAMWVGYAISIEMYSIAFICTVFATIAIRNWFNWE